MTADTTYGDSNTVPKLIRGKRDGSWRLWDNLARKAGDFGRPNAFSGNIEETKWRSPKPLSSPSSTRSARP
jgi:oleate hydratase